MKRKGMTLDVSSSGALAKSLDLCVVSSCTNTSHPPMLLGVRSPLTTQDPSEPEFNTLVRIMATRCMLAAEYFCSGSVSKEAFGHYGLASPIYTHFTVSPSDASFSLQSHRSARFPPHSTGNMLIMPVTHQAIRRRPRPPTAIRSDQLHTASPIFAVQIAR